MQKLTFINPMSESFVVTYSKPFVLQDLVGLSDIPVEMLATVGYNQDGQTPKGQIFQPRPISFSVVVLGENAGEVFERRRQLLRFFNPKYEFRVIYENDYVTVKFDCRIDGPPRFPPTQSNNGRPDQKCAISLICDNPYLFDVNETTVSMSIEEPKFGFPLMFFNEITMSTLIGTRVVVNNTGDVDTPVKIQFNGATVNPKIINETTGEYIKVNREIQEDEILEIFTGYGKKYVEIIKPDGSRENAFHYIDLTSKFFQLVAGGNILSYEADSGADSAMVFIYYTNRYVGV